MSLGRFVDLIEERVGLLRVGRPVDPAYEIASVIKRLGGRPVVFEHVKGRSMPVVSNVCSTRDLVCLGLGIERGELIQRLADAAENPGEPEIVPADGYEEVAPDLSRLPVLTYHREDGGPYIASGIVVAVDEEYGLNASYHRSLVKGTGTLVLRILERHLHAYMKRGLRRFALCVGNPIPVLLASAMSVELGKSELGIADALARTRLIELDGHVVPPSEIVMICTFTGEMADEGPFLDLTETFDVVRKQPVARVEKIFVREGALFHALLPGDLEHKVLMGMPREPTIFREVSKVCTCLDVHVTPGGCSWLHAVVRIRKQAADDGRKAIEAAFRGHRSVKHVYVVDEDIDVEDPGQVEWAMATRFQGDRDMVIRPREKGSSLDPSADVATRKTTKVGFDLTVPDLFRAGTFRRAAPPLDIDLDDYL
ncbi:MAG: UbiD family decarboxylase [Deltaproteobacteria bacterium]|nr:UbiD family decarboxylase [Deltaproteobacteria bacterium]